MLWDFAKSPFGSWHKTHLFQILLNKHTSQERRMFMFVNRLICSRIVYRYLLFGYKGEKGKVCMGRIKSVVDERFKKKGKIADFICHITPLMDHRFYYYFCSGAFGPLGDAFSCWRARLRSSSCSKTSGRGPSKGLP